MPIPRGPGHVQPVPGPHSIFRWKTVNPPPLLSLLCGAALPSFDAAVCSFSWRSPGRVHVPDTPLAIHRRTRGVVAHLHLGCLRRHRPGSGCLVLGISFNGPANSCDRSQPTDPRLRNPCSRHRPALPIPPVSRLPLQLRFRQRHTVPPLQRHLLQRPVPQPAQFLYRQILRPLPPGGLPPVAPDGSLQQLPRPLVFEKRQCPHRRKGRPVLPPLRRLPQPRRPSFRRSVAGHAQKAPLRG